jgi:aminoglycoside phosphotransferase (APT) family kinase protein
MTSLSLPPVDAPRLVGALRRRLDRPGLELAEGPTHLATGGEAVIDTFRLSGVEPELAGPLVLRRLMPLKDPGQLLWEAAVHEGLAVQGFPVPRVLCVDSDPATIGSAYLVADRIPGEILLQEMLDMPRVIRRPWRIPPLVATALFQVPGLLAETQIRLHALDPEPVRSALRARGLDPAAIGYEARLADLRSRIDSAALTGLGPGIEWLEKRRPVEADPVVCHGDLVFTNLCVEGGRVTGVFDWSFVTLAPPAFDLAASLARLTSRVPNLPRALDLLIQRVQVGVERRYRRAYGPVPEEALRYYEAYWLLSELSRSGIKLREGIEPNDAIEQRWLYAETIGEGVRRFARMTGVTLSPLLPAAHSS